MKAKGIDTAFAGPWVGDDFGGAGLCTGPFAFGADAAGAKRHAAISRAPDRGAGGGGWAGLGLDRVSDRGLTLVYLTRLTES